MNFWGIFEKFLWTFLGFLGFFAEFLGNFRGGKIWDFRVEQQKKKSELSHGKQFGNSQLHTLLSSRFLHKLVRLEMKINS